MNCTLVIDWKFVAALGGVAFMLTLASKLNAEGSKEVSICAINAGKECAVAAIGNC